MEIRNYLNALNPIGSTARAGSQPAAPAQNGDAADKAAQDMDRATVSAAGAGISQTASDADVRWEKVTAIQQALANGSYNVPASAVATKMVDSMLGKRS